MRSSVRRDPFFYIAVTLAVVGTLILAIVYIVWGASFISSMNTVVTFLTGILIWYYLVETRRLRLGNDARNEPFLVLTFDLNGFNGLPTIFLRNLGGGVAVNVNLRWLNYGGIPRRCVKTYVGAISPAPEGQTVVGVLPAGSTVNSIQGTRVEIRCGERPGYARPSHCWRWVGEARFWHGGLGGDGFRLENC